MGEYLRISPDVSARERACLNIACACNGHLDSATHALHHAFLVSQPYHDPASRLTGVNTQTCRWASFIVLRLGFTDVPMYRTSRMWAAKSQQMVYLASADCYPQHRDEIMASPSISHQILHNVPEEVPARTPDEIPSERPVEVPRQEPIELPHESPLENPTVTPTEIPMNRPAEEPLHV